MHRLLKNRYVLPAGLIAAVAVGGLLTLAPGASAVSGGPTPTTTPTSQNVGGTGTNSFNAGVTLPPGVRNPSNLSGPRNSGGPNSSVRVYKKTAHGKELVAYGNRAITYSVPPRSFIPLGEALFQQNCATCHGTQAEGSAVAPDLQGVGPATVDFWVSTGRMPATSTNQVQAPSKPPRLSKTQALEVAAYVNSLDPAVPYIPTPHLNSANVSEGASLFALNCAACHTITGAGDALAFNTFAPSLHQATARQVAEAIRTGPANMPRFTGNLNDAQTRDVVAYVTQYIQHPSSPGGVGLGGIGPVAEGFIALLLGVGGFVLVCFWIGDRS